MEQQKQKRLESIQNEVKDFHPLLNIVLPKIANVKNVEYTHGVNEMGADFVLSRLDETFGTLDYIGVIAKIGKIDQSGVSDIDRQIEECYIPKFFGGGKEKVTISEIWVVNNSTISHGAQTKIHEKYRGRKITFINEEKLAKLIDEFAPNYWTDIPLKIGDYLNTLRLKNDEIDRAVSLAKNHADIYVQQDVYTISEEAWEPQKKTKKKAHKVDVIEVVKRQSAIIIEGEMGAGKTKLQRHLVRYFSHPQNYLETNIVPIFISYKNLIDNFGGNLMEVLGSYIDQGALVELGQTASFLFLIDGVDEKNTESEEQLKMLAELIKQAGDEVVKKKIESTLASFSEMQLLCLFQQILRQSYAYEFFKKAIETAVLEIDAMDISPSAKAVALFFLNVIYIDLDGKESFDLILKDHAKRLPMSVQLAIMHETQDFKTKSALLKHHEKSLKRSMRDNKLLKEQLDIMYDRSIKSLKEKIT